MTGVQTCALPIYGNPLVLDLGILVITFALQIKITVASIIGVIAAIVIYRFI